MNGATLSKDRSHGDMPTWQIIWPEGRHILCTKRNLAMIYKINCAYHEFIPLNKANLFVKIIPL